MSSTTNSSDAPLAWEIFRHQPPPPLHALVSGYVGYTMRSETARLQRETPGTSVPFIIPLGPELQVGTARQVQLRPYEGGFVAGMDDTYAVTRSQGTSGGIQVDFSPLVARALYGLPMSELTGRIVDLDAIFGREGRDLAEAVRGSAAWEERFALIDSFLLRRLARAVPPSKGVLWAWSQMRLSCGRTPVGDLAQQLGWNHKRLIREFKENVGIAPKTAARVIRFERLNTRLHASSPVSWADLAGEFGYFDQSHLVRDVVQFTGRTPREHLQALRADTAFRD